jgi:hypothetical protein
MESMECSCEHVNEISGSVGIGAFLDQLRGCQFPERLCGLVVSEFLTTDSETRVRFPALPEKKVMGLERGQLSLVSTTEELLDRKAAAPA